MNTFTLDDISIGLTQSFHVSVTTEMLEKFLEIHSVKLVSREYHVLIRVLAFKVNKIFSHCIGGSFVPAGGIVKGLDCRQYFDKSLDFVFKNEYNCIQD